MNKRKFVPIIFMYFTATMFNPHAKILSKPLSQKYEKPQHLNIKNKNNTPVHQINIKQKTRLCKNKNTNIKTLNQILNEQPLSLLSDKFCKSNPELCHVSKTLANDIYVKKDFKKMYVAILLHESLNFQFTSNSMNKWIVGFAQINTQVWTAEKLEKWGYKPKDLWTTKGNIQIGEMIFWHNFVLAYAQNPNRKALLDYSASYYGLTMPNWYVQKVASIYFNKEAIDKALNKTLG